VKAGWTARDFVEAGWTARDFVKAGLTARDFVEAGWIARDFVEAGWTEESMESPYEKDIKAKAIKMGRGEAEGVVATIRRGLMDGSSYGTLETCGCFLGSAAKKAGKTVEQFCAERGIVKDGSSPAEEWFMAVCVGDTPENNYAAKKGVEWIEEAFAESK
jgi:hypothetical protein